VHINQLPNRIGGISPKGNPVFHVFHPHEYIYIPLSSAGPIVEQGTHFCDLSRYFGGEVDLSTINAHSLEWDENAGHLSKIPIDESKIKPENRIPRVTAATWCAFLIIFYGIQ